MVDLGKIRFTQAGGEESFAHWGAQQAGCTSRKIFPI